MTDNYLISNKIDLFGLQPPSISNIKSSTSNRVLKSENSAFSLSTLAGENLLTDVTDNPTVENRIPTFSATNKDLKQSTASIVGNNMSINTGGKLIIDSIDTISAFGLGPLANQFPTVSGRVALIRDIERHIYQTISNVAPNVNSLVFSVNSQIIISQISLAIRVDNSGGGGYILSANLYENGNLLGAFNSVNLVDGYDRYIMTYNLLTATLHPTAHYYIHFSATVSPGDNIILTTFFIE